MIDTTRLLSPDVVAEDRIVLRDGSVAVNGVEFTRRVHRAANGLSLAGAARGQLWGWSGPPTVAGLIELHAILETGAVLVPFNPAMPATDLERAISSLPLAGISRLEGTAADVDRKSHDGHPDPARLAPLIGAAADPLALIWTSGSSGDPRGIVLTDSAVRWHARMVQARLDLGSDDLWAATLSPAHVGGLMLVLRATILGCGVRSCAGFDPADVVRSIEEEGVTHASLVPTMLRRMAEHLESRTEGATALGGSPRAILIGGAHAPPELLLGASRLGIPVAATWGMSEMSSQVATATPHETTANPEQVGTPLNGVDVRVAPDGELEVRGPTLAAARFTITPDRIVPESLLEDGWFATGDLGTIDDAGRIRVTGRKGLRIISGGVNVDPLEVEAALRKMDGISATLVVGLPDPEWGERVCALVVEDPPRESPIRRPAIVAAARDHLSGARLPRLVVSVPKLPANANGKLDRLRARVILDAHRRDPIDD